MELYKNTNAFYAKNQGQWRNWLLTNHEKCDAVWLIIYKKTAATDSIYYPEAVDEALCFGWIDSVANKRDDESYYQFFSKRKPKSNWSRVNKEKVKKLLSAGLMQPAGIAMVELAKQSGTWDALHEVEQLKLSDELIKEFKKNKTAYKNWNAFAKSSRRGILEWILNAKRPETKAKRIAETVKLAGENIKANFPLKK